MANSDYLKYLFISIFVIIWQYGNVLQYGKPYIYIKPHKCDLSEMFRCPVFYHDL